MSRGYGRRGNSDTIVDGSVQVVIQEWIGPLKDSMTDEAGIRCQPDSNSADKGTRLAQPPSLLFRSHHQVRVLGSWIFPAFYLLHRIVHTYYPFVLAVQPTGLGELLAPVPSLRGQNLS